MSRYTDRAVIAYDSDEAGKRATLRAIPLLEKTGMSVKVVDMGESKDPDEFLNRHGADAFEVLLERSENHIEYRLMTIKNQSNLTSDEGRLSFLAAATELLSELESKPEREVYGARVAKAAGISTEAVENEVEKKIRMKNARQKKEIERQVKRPTAAMQPADRSLRYENEYSAAAEERLIRALALDSELMQKVLDMGFSQDEFTSQFLAKVFRALEKRVSEGRDTRMALILSELEKHEASQLTVILQKPGTLPYSDKTVRECIEKIRTEKYKAGPPDEDILLEIRKFKQRVTDS